MLQQCCTCRRAQLTLYLTTIDWHILQHQCCCRRWNRKYAMGTSYLTGTYMYWRSQYTIRMQLFYQHTYSHNIRNGIHRSYLMKSHTSVGMCVMMLMMVVMFLMTMTMFMHFLTFRYTLYSDFDMGSYNATLHSLSAFKCHIRYSDL